MYIMKKDHKQRRSFRLGLRAKILGGIPSGYDHYGDCNDRDCL